ncbi:Hypothetical predicted protein [Marmota monax]|uniref:GAGE domain-containing protein n=1 Tax=Marmota monax TaxID=9995 RepID=A0A5E4DJF9_MARMO|nr:Hypothetical predicted protein [Marmota monax]
MGQMLGSQVTVTGPEEEDQGHQVPALTENPEPMEEQAKGVLPGEPGGDPGAHVLSIILFGIKYLEFLHPTRDGPNVGKVTVTGPEEEDHGHQVPALTENPEPMEEQAKGEEN